MVSKLPDYEWVCQSCQATNPPLQGRCLECDFGARFTQAELEQVQGKMPPLPVSAVDAVALVIILLLELGFYFAFRDAPWVLFVGWKVILLGGLLVGAALLALVHALAGALVGALRGSRLP